MKKDKSIEYFDRASFVFLCLLVFFAGVSNAAIEVCFSLALFLFVIKLIISGRRWRDLLSSTKLNLPILAFVLVSAVSLINSIYLRESFRDFIGKTGEYAILYFLTAALINSRKRIYIVLSILLFSSLIIGIDGLWQQFNGIGFLRQRHLMAIVHLTGPFKHYNSLGAYLTIMLPLVLGVLAVKGSSGIRGRLEKVGLVGLAVLLSVCLGLTYSRGAWLGFIAALGIIGYWAIRSLGYRAKILTLLLIIICLVGISFILPNLMKERAISIVKMQDSGRFDIWRGTIKMIQDKPLFGHGAGSFIYIYDRYKVTGGSSTYAHNCYLQIAAEAGLAGLACFLWILLRWCRLMIYMLKKEKGSLLWGLSLGLFAGISAFLVHCFFDNNLYSLQLSILFWFMLGFTVSIEKKSKIGAGKGS